MHAPTVSQQIKSPQPQLLTSPVLCSPTRRPPAQSRAQQPDLLLDQAFREVAPKEKSKHARSVAGQLEATEKSVLVQVPELAEGQVVLGRE
ncbi:hypothetical protein Q7P35_000504 [Cladosporium inversicolor]